MSRKITDAEIKKLRERGFIAAQTTRERLLQVLELLLEFTNENEGLTARETARVLSACGNTAPAENTLRDDLCAIAKSAPFGIKVEAPTKGDNRGYRVVNRLINPDEAVLLLDMIHTCKFIPTSQQQVLELKLLPLIPEAKQDEVIETIIPSSHESADHANVLPALNTASRAIMENKQISFSYMMHWMNGAYVETPMQTAEPISILFSFGHYYLEVLLPTKDRDDQQVEFRRFDRISKLVITGLKIEHKKQVEQLRKAAPSLLGEMIDMRGDGISRTLFLRVDGKLSGAVYDRFGHDIKFEHISETATDVIGHVKIKVQLSETFFRWLFGMNDGVRLIRPRSTRWLRAFQGMETFGQEEYESLLNDYKTANYEYKKLLESALSVAEES